MMMLKRLKLKMNNQGNPTLDQRVSNLGLHLIGVISLGYVCFMDRFAELNIQLPFLNFPIFIGEIFLFTCLLLLFFKWKISGQELTALGYVALVYFAFILYKAIAGYLEWGPLALRHSALFYYPLFAVLGYFFFNRKYFSDRRSFFLITLLIFILVGDKKFLYIVEWSRIGCFILLFVLIKQLSRNKMRYLLFLVLFICVPYRLLFFGHRAMLVSNIASLFFLIITLPLVVKMKKNVEIGIVILAMAFLYLGAKNFSDKNAFYSISNLQVNLKAYKKYEADIARILPYFKMEPVKQLHVYNRSEDVIYEEKIPVQSMEMASQELSAEKTVLSLTRPPVEAISKEVKLALGKHKFEKNSVDLITRKKQPTQQQAALKQQLDQPEKKVPFGQYRSRDLGTTYNNSFFRLFIWQDMVADLNAKKPILGFAFGKPFRSKKIEMLNIAHGEWQRDGWIAAHNSYFEIVYRLGIIGIMLILLIVSVFFKMVFMSINSKSIVGLLLCGMLLNWLVCANFMLILELPYHAIPFWSLFGMSLAYLKGIDGEKRFRDKSMVNP